MDYIELDQIKKDKRKQQIKERLSAIGKGFKSQAVAVGSRVVRVSSGVGRAVGGAIKQYKEYNTPTNVRQRLKNERERLKNERLRLQIQTQKEKIYSTRSSGASIYDGGMGISGGGLSNFSAFSSNTMKPRMKPRKTLKKRSDRIIIIRR